MSETTYRELFQASLEGSIGAYGEFSRVVALVNIYQGSDPVARHYAFEEWVEDASFLCRRCEEEFTPDADGLEEDAAVLCERCAGS